MSSKFPVIFIPHTTQLKSISQLDKQHSLYIHIPFCVKKCNFCSIKTNNYNEDCIDTYVQTILTEINNYKYLLDKSDINCVHFGGGTPSLLTVSQIDTIFSGISDSIKYPENTEFVFEAHPDSLDYEKIDYLAKFTNLTLNIGIQTFKENQLELVNRKLEEKDLIKKLIYAKGKSFLSLGVDIIVGLPGSSVESVIDDITYSAELGVDNISLYPLRIEKGALLYKKTKDPNYASLKERELINIFEIARNYLKELGYESSSIFHWKNSKKDVYRYSNSQMMGGEWIGIGAGAYSYLDGCVYLNREKPSDYITAVKEGTSSYQSVEKHNMTSKFIWDLSFLLRSGIYDQKQFVKIFGELAYPYLNEILSKINELGYATMDNDGFISITPKGIVNFDNIEELIRMVVKSKDGKN